MRDEPRPLPPKNVDAKFFAALINKQRQQPHIVTPTEQHKQGHDHLKLSFCIQSGVKHLLTFTKPRQLRIRMLSFLQLT